MQLNPAKPAGDAVWFRVSSKRKILEVTGAAEEIVGKTIAALWHRPLSDALDPGAAILVANAIADLQHGRVTSRLIHHSRRDREPAPFRLDVRKAGASLVDGISVTLTEMEPTDAWSAPSADDLIADLYGNADAFLEQSAALLAGGRSDHSLTMIGVTGGLEAFRTEEDRSSFRRIVDTAALEMGAFGTADLANGAYGVLHATGFDSDRMVRSVGSEAVAGGILDRADMLLSARIDPDGTDLDTLHARGTVSHVLDGLRAGRDGRAGLGAAHDIALLDAGARLDLLAAAVRAGRFRARVRPIVALERQRVAIHEFRADPLIDGQTVTASGVFALVDATEVQIDCELAVIALAARHCQDVRDRGLSLVRVMVPVRADFLRRADVRQRLAATAAGVGMDPANLVLRPYDPVGGSLTGKGETVMDLIDSLPCTLSLSDFTAFVAVDAGRRKDVRSSGAVAAYIEVAVGRLRDLAGQPQGRDLVASPIGTWRTRGIEVLASGVNNRADREIATSLNIRYARGRAIGDWSNLA